LNPRNTFLARDSKTLALLPLQKDDYYLINNTVDTYIREHTNFLAGLPNYLTWVRSGRLESIPEERPFGVGLGEYFEEHRSSAGDIAVAVWICMGLGLGVLAFKSLVEENEAFLCLSPFALIFALVVLINTRPAARKILDAITAFLLAEKREAAGRLEYLRAQTKINQSNLQIKLTDMAAYKKKLLEGQFESESASYRQSGFHLKRSEAAINKQLEFISASQARLTRAASMLDELIKDTPSDISTDDQRRDRERTSTALKYLSQQHSMYKAKLDEVELLRLNNVLQAETPRQKVTQEDRNAARKKIGLMAKLSDRIYKSLKSANVAGAGSERLWLERITLVREALMKLNNSLTSHMVNLDHEGRDEEATDLPLEVTSGLDRLAAYLTEEDFDREYQLLQAKYGKQ
jgi:hypothetical protein